MLLGRFMCLNLLTAILPNVVRAGHFDCAADWPSESLEKCQYEGEENRPKPVGPRIARRYLPNLTTVTFLDDDIEDDIIDRNMANMTKPQSDSKSEPEGAEDDNSITTRGAADGPAWPNKWTTLPCCQLTCACYKYLAGPGNTQPKKGSEGWKKQKCCYQKMLNDPNCANPPPFKAFDVVEPPWCLR